MSVLMVSLAGDDNLFAPGEEIAGTASWHLDEEPESVELRLFWYTEGRGTQDVEVVETVRFEAPGRADRRPFELRAPERPLTFSGKLISLIWALELVAEPGTETARQEIVLSTLGREIRLDLEQPEEAADGDGTSA